MPKKVASICAVGACAEARRSSAIDQRQILDQKRQILDHEQQILDQQRQTSRMFLPCRFCTRMSLICPINSSRSNQSAQPRPAIWSRAESRRDPGRIAHKAPPGGGGGGEGGGAAAAAPRSGLLSSRSAWSLADTRADINGREPLHQPTWPLLERLPPARRPQQTQGGEERPSGEQPQHLGGISEVGGV